MTDADNNNDISPDGGEGQVSDGPPTVSETRGEEAAPLLDASDAGMGLTSDEDAPFPRIDGYEIVEAMQAGGQGKLYKARELTPAGREVVLKFPRAGILSSERAVALFENEVQKAASLDHPNIARIYSSGLYDRMPFYSMEFIDGVDLGEYAQEANLGQREILELMRTICLAVQHAHQRQIVHRDLKPANIMVTTGGAVPKLLDFGLAIDETELQASIDRGVGTLVYMSPEQAAYEPVTTQTDVYSLGVILYKLLTGKHPHGFTPEDWRILAPGQFRDRIANGDVIRPRRVSARIDKELEALLLKALAYDLQLRYGSAGELAADIGNYLTGEPLTAKAPTTMYFLRKRLRKYRVQVATAAAVAAVLLGVAVFAYVRVAEERNAAVDSRNEAVHQKKLAEDTLAIARLFHELVPLDKADLGGHKDNLQRINAFVAAYPANLRIDEVARRQTQEAAGFTSKVDEATARFDLASFTRLFAADEGFRDVAQRAISGEAGARIWADMKEYLEISMIVPTPVGRTRETLDAAHSLLLLDPGNSRARSVLDQIAALDKSAPVIYEDSFENYRDGQMVEGWESLYGSGPGKVRAATNEVFVPSTFANTGELRRKCKSDADYISMKTTLRYQLYDEKLADEFGGGIQLLGTELICGVGVTAGHFRLYPYEITPPNRRRARPNTKYVLEVRYFPRRGTFDALIDGEYFADEAGVISKFPVKELSIHSRAANMLVSDVVVRAGNIQVKRQLGRHVPVVTRNDLGLRLAGWLAQDHTSLVVHDFNADGAPEIVTGSTAPSDAGKLMFYRYDPVDVELKLLREVVLGGDYRLAPKCMIDGSLCVWGFGQRKPVRDGSTDLGFRMMQVGPDFALKAIFSRQYVASGRCSVAPMNYGGGKRGFAVGLKEYVRSLELFERTGSDQNPKFVSRGLFPYRNDILSVEPYDWDGDGADDLFVGFGSWRRYCPSLVEIHDFKPTAGLPLTPKVGITYLSMLRPAAGDKHLVAVSTRMKTREGVPIKGYGLRIWRLGRKEAVLSYHEKGEFAGGAAVDGLSGRKLFAVPRSVRNPRHGELAMGAIVVYEMVGEDVRPVFEVRLPGFTGVEPSFLDLDGDGKSELVLSLGRSGMLVFTGK